MWKFLVLGIKFLCKRFQCKIHVILVALDVYSVHVYTHRCFHWVHFHLCANGVFMVDYGRKVGKFCVAKRDGIVYHTFPVWPCFCFL